MSDVVWITLSYAAGIIVGLIVGYATGSAK